MLSNETLSLLGIAHGKVEFHIPGNDVAFSLLQHAQGVKDAVERLRQHPKVDHKAMLEIANYAKIVDMVATTLAVMSVIPPTTKLLKEVAHRIVEDLPKA